MSIEWPAFDDCPCCGTLTALSGTCLDCERAGCASADACQSDHVRVVAEGGADDG